MSLSSSCLLLAVMLVITALDFANGRVIPSRCNLPKPTIGEVRCSGYEVERQWFYSADEDRCNPFVVCAVAILGSLQNEGPENRFDSSAECEAACIGASRSVTQRDLPKPQVRSVPDSEGNSTGCPDPIPIPNGNVTIENNAAAYSCREGYVMSGDNRLLCLENGTWNSDPPHCNSIQGPPVVQCSPEPIDYMYGMRYSCLTAGCTVTYTCQKGYTLLGDETRTCNSDGQWIGTPFCARLVIQYNQVNITNTQLNLTEGTTKVHIDCIMFPRFPAGLIMNWTKQQGGLAVASRGRWNPDAVQRSTYLLVFDKLLMEEHSSTYICRVVGSQLQVSFTLRVLRAAKPTSRPPTVVSVSFNRTLTPHQDLSLICIMNGDPVPELVWRRNGRPLEGNVIITRTTSDATSSVLNVQNVGVADAGLYECVGTNIAGSATAAFTITISGGPGKRSVSENKGLTDVRHLCKSTTMPDPDIVTIVGKIGRRTDSNDGFDTYQVQITSVLSGSARSGLWTLIITARSPRLPHLRRGSSFVIQAKAIGTKLYTLGANSVFIHSKQLQDLIQSC